MTRKRLMKKLTAVAVIVVAMIILTGCTDYGDCLNDEYITTTSVVMVGKTTQIVVGTAWVCHEWQYPTGRPE